MTTIDGRRRNIDRRAQHRRLADLGTATSGVTFFRTLGGAFGTIYSNALTTDLTAGVAAAVRTGAADPIIHAYADALRTVFLWTVPVRWPGSSCRCSSSRSGCATAPGSARPTWRGLRVTDRRGLAVPAGVRRRRIIRGTEADTMRRVVAASGTRLDVAGAWAVVQVELATRMTGRADLNAIAAGSAEAELIGRAWTEWLEERVERDIGRPTRHRPACRGEDGGPPPAHGGRDGRLPAGSGRCGDGPRHSLTGRHRRPSPGDYGRLARFPKFSEIVCP